MFYVFMDSGEDGSWVQFSEGFLTLIEAEEFKVDLCSWEEYTHFNKCIMEEL